jgi:hypothetical protein
MGFNSAFKGLNSICHLLALLGAHHIFHVSGLRVNHNTAYKHVCIYEPLIMIHCTLEVVSAWEFMEK